MCLTRWACHGNNISRPELPKIRKIYLNLWRKCVSTSGRRNVAEAMGVSQCAAEKAERTIFRWISPAIHPSLLCRLCFHQGPPHHSAFSVHLAATWLDLRLGCSSTAGFSQNLKFRGFCCPIAETSQISFYTVWTVRRCCQEGVPLFWSALPSDPLGDTILWHN